MKLQNNTEKLREIAEKYGLKLILVFGSLVSGKTYPKSDIDIAVLAKNPDFSFKKYSALLFEPQEVFKEGEVDLAFLNRSGPPFLKEILGKCKLLFGSYQGLAQLRILAFKKYVEHKKYLDMERKFAQMFIRESVKRVRV